jgi:hypothetical protein
MSRTWASSSRATQPTSDAARLSTSGQLAAECSSKIASITPAWRRQYGRPEASTQCSEHQVVVQARERRST